MPRLNSRQRAHLRGLAHPLKPLVHIGKGGVTDTTVTALREVLGTHELLKVRILEAAPEAPRDTATALGEALADTHVVQVIGRTIVLYRADPDEPRIRLPHGGDA